MEKIINNKYCCGCTACKNICPKGAIEMVEDNEGFLYPSINQDKCINCGLCRKACPVLNKNENDALNKCYVGYNRNENEILNGSSGAIFSLIAETIISNRGIAVGAAFDDNSKLHHCIVTDMKYLNKLKKSKYLQSNLGDIFKIIKENLKENKTVLFCGTPCQVAGLKSFLNEDYDNLICIDIICHGVPTPKLFNKYIEELEEENNEKLISYDFRDKSTGWDTYSNKAQFKSKTITTSKYNNKYMQLFLSDFALRKSCYNCNFKLGNKYSDITLGDFWGIKKINPEMYNKNGVSCIIVNTEKGNKVFNEIRDNIKYKECNINDIVSGNKSLAESANHPEKRKQFFEDIDNYNINQLIKKYKKKVSIFRKIKNKIMKIIK